MAETPFACECLDFSFYWILLFFVHCCGVKFDVVLVTKLDDGCGVLSGACVHAKLVDPVAMSIVEVDDVTEGFDECCGGFVFGHNPMAIAGADVFEDEPACKTSYGYGGDLALVIDGDNLTGVVGFDARSVGFVELVSFSKFARGAWSFTHDAADERWCEFLVNAMPSEFLNASSHH